MRTNLQGEIAVPVASRHRHSNIVQALTECASAYDKEDEHASDSRINEEVSRATNQDEGTTLHVAVRNNCVAMVNSIFLNDPHFAPPMNKMGETLLYLAIERNYHEIADLIFANCDLPTYHRLGSKSALHVTVLSDCITCTQNLIAKNSAVTRQRDELGWIPLHYAS